MSALGPAAAGAGGAWRETGAAGDTGAALLGRSLDPRRLGLWIFLATVTMLFAAFSSAYLVRMASGSWHPIALPGVMWLGTAVLVTSSGTLELARQARGRAVGRWLQLTLLLGLLFLGAQALAWLALRDAGVLLPQSPHAAFLYIFTALHGAHLMGGLIWLALLVAAARAAVAGARAPGGESGRLGDRLARCATYWHFMGGLWVYLFAVLHLR